MRSTCLALLLACLALAGCEKKVEMATDTVPAKPGDVTVTNAGAPTPSAPAK